MAAPPTHTPPDMDQDDGTVLCLPCEIPYAARGPARGPPRARPATTHRTELEKAKVSVAQDRPVWLRDIPRDSDLRSCELDMFVTKNSNVNLDQVTTSCHNKDSFIVTSLVNRLLATIDIRIELGLKLNFWIGGPDIAAVLTGLLDDFTLLKFINQSM